jgi:hypothetical protein
VVIEEDPQNGVRIKLLDGTLRTLKPAQVQEIRYRGSAANVAGAAPAAQASAAPAPPTALQAAPPALPTASPALPAAPPALQAAPTVGTTPGAAPASQPPSPSANDDDASVKHHNARPKFQIGVRLGYAVPMGHLTGAGVTTDAQMNMTTYVSSAMSDVISFKIPILFEAGYEITPNIVLGAHIQYGVISEKAGPDGCESGLNCSDHDIEIGLQGQYHFAPDTSVDPWLGVGLGYEIESYSASGSVADPIDKGTFVAESYGGSLAGPQYLKLQGGVDFLAARAFTLGPFCSLSIAQYSTSTSDSSTFGTTTSPPTTQDIPFTALHEWLSIGVKGAFRIGTD